MVGMINLCFVGGDGRDWRPATPVTAKAPALALIAARGRSLLSLGGSPGYSARRKSLPIAAEMWPFPGPTRLMRM
jgi:hypothetical protein